MSYDSINWYSHIAESADDLREQIKQMRRDSLSPKRFGLYVRSHPDSLTITAANKMQTGVTVVVKQNYSGKLFESYILPVEGELNESNRALIQKYWKSGFGKGESALQTTEKGWFINDVDSKEIENFLIEFRVHPDLAEKRSAVISYLRSIVQNHPSSDVLLISINKKSDTLKFVLGAQSRESASVIDGTWRLSKDRVASRGDEKLGLEFAEQLKATELAKESSKEPSDYHYRAVRNKPLLMIHHLNLGEGENTQKDVPAFGISFPPGDYSEGVEIVANKVYMKQLVGDMNDSPDQEEGYDE